MEQFGITVDMIAAAIPPKTGNSSYDWKRALEHFLRADRDDSVLDLDLGMALDRYFGLPDGWWTRLEVSYNVQCELLTNAPWLKRIRRDNGVDPDLVRKQAKALDQKMSRLHAYHVSQHG